MLTIQDVKNGGGVYLFYKSLPVVIIISIILLVSTSLTLFPKNFSSSLFVLFGLLLVCPMPLLAYHSGRHFRWCQKNFLAQEIKKCARELPKKKFVHEKDALEESKALFEGFMVYLEKEEKDPKRLVYATVIIIYYAALIIEISLNL